MAKFEVVVPSETVEALLKKLGKQPATGPEDQEIYSSLHTAYNEAHQKALGRSYQRPVEDNTYMMGGTRVVFVKAIYDVHKGSKLVYADRGHQGSVIRCIGDGTFEIQLDSSSIIVLARSDQINMVGVQGG